MPQIQQTASTFCLKKASVNSLDSTPATDTNGPSTSAAAAAARLRIAARDNKAKRQASPNSSATATKRSSFPVIAQKAQPKPPPIVLRDIISINELLLCIEEVCSLSNLQVKSSMGESLRIYADDSDTYRKIVRQLEEMKIELHSYQLKEDKPFRVVVRGLHYSQIHIQIAVELKYLGHSVLTIHNPISKKTGERMNLFFINIEAKDNNKKILEVRALCHQLVRIETARKSQDLVQCRRCQEFGHTAKDPFVVSLVEKTTSHLNAPGARMNWLHASTAKAHIRPTFAAVNFL